MRTEKNGRAKPMVNMLVLVLLLIAIIVGNKVILVRQMLTKMKPPAVVSKVKMTPQQWQIALTAVGTLRAVHDTDLALDTNSRVTKMGPKSGDAEEVAQSRQLQSAALAQVIFNRVKKERPIEAIGKAD
jgi:hypothetical protein